MPPRFLPAILLLSVMRASMRLIISQVENISRLMISPITSTFSSFPRALMTSRSKAHMTLDADDICITRLHFDGTSNGRSGVDIRLRRWADDSAPGRQAADWHELDAPNALSVTAGCYLRMPYRRYYFLENIRPYQPFRQRNARRPQVMCLTAPSFCRARIRDAPTLSRSLPLTPLGFHFSPRHKVGALLAQYYLKMLLSRFPAAISPDI